LSKKHKTDAAPRDDKRPSRSSVRAHKRNERRETPTKESFHPGKPKKSAHEASWGGNLPGNHAGKTQKSRILLKMHRRQYITMVNAKNATHNMYFT
jgi:hypothetical protein